MLNDHYYQLYILTLILFFDDNINNIAPKSTSLGAQGITQSVNRYANLIIKDNLRQCKLSISVNSQVTFCNKNTLHYVRYKNIYKSKIVFVYAQKIYVDTLYLLACGRNLINLFYPAYPALPSRYSVINYHRSLYRLERYSCAESYGMWRKNLIVSTGI